MANLSTHFKERQPLETVQIIKDFFNKYNLSLKESDINESEAGTWYCHITLYQNNIEIISSNGKGVTKEYALASGYAETYERFCNGMTFLANPYFNRTLISYNKEHFGYYLRENEKILTYDEIINNTNRTKIYFNKLTSDIPVLTKKVIDFITEGQYIGLPYQNIGNHQDIKYVDPRILLRITRSVGMAAGNTIEEGLVQGLSEIAEKNAQKQLFQNFSDTHYAINLDKIADPTLQKIIMNIKNCGYDLYLFDLSYNYKIPVIMSLLIDRAQGIMNINFGSFPVFEIAAERVLTEIYQGIKTYHQTNFLSRLQTPFKLFSSDELFEIYGNGIDGKIFPAIFFKNIEYVDSYNTQIFVADKNISNQELVQYFYQLGETLNLHFYYIDNSLDENIHAIQVFVDGENEDIFFHGTEEFNIEWNNQKIIQLTNILNGFIKLCDYISTNKTISGIDIIKLIIDYSNVPFDLQFALVMIQLWNYMLISSDTKIYLDILYGLIDDDHQDDTYLENLIASPIYSNFKKYIQLKKYISTGLYTDEELLYIFNTIFHYNLSLEDLQNSTNTFFLVQKAYLEPMKIYINSEEYKKLIQIFTNVLHS